MPVPRRGYKRCSWLQVNLQCTLDAQAHLIPVQAKASGDAAPGLGAFAFLAWAGPQRELRLHSDEAHASQRLQEPTGAALKAYESPLLMFHTYRWVQAARGFALLRLMCGGATCSWSTHPIWLGVG